MKKKPAPKSILSALLFFFILLTNIPYSQAVPSCVGCGPGGTPAPTQSPSPDTNDEVTSFSVFYSSTSQVRVVKNEKTRLENTLKALVKKINRSKKVEIRILSWAGPSKKGVSQKVAKARLVAISKYLKSLGIKGTFVLKTLTLKKMNNQKTKRSDVFILLKD